MADQRPFGWGFIGASHIAESMIAAVNPRSDSRVVGVMSTSMQRGQDFAARNNIPNAYDSVEELLDNPEIDAVFIGTTNELHHTQVLAAAKAGKHVLCEKPLALSVKDGLEMVKACREAGVVMGTCHHMRALSLYKVIRQKIEAGEIGKLLAIRVAHGGYLPEELQTWRLTSPEAGAGVILDITVHDSDILRFVTQDEVETVTAISAQQGMASGPVEDSVMGVMQFSKGTLVQFHNSFMIRHGMRGFEVDGTEGSLIAGGALNRSQPESLFLKHFDRLEEIDLPPREDIHYGTVEAFYRATQGDGQPLSTGEDGFRAMAIALAVRKSASRRETVRVRYE